MKLEILTKVTDAAPMIINEDGFGVVKARVSRDGVQPYLGEEVDLATFGETIISVWRDPKDVGSPESLASFAHATLTNDHPYDDVTLANWEWVAQGELSTDAEFVDGYVEVTIYVKGKEVMADILSGKVELSLGYSCIYDLRGGTTPDGIPFDAKQIDIRVNHCAVVDRGRAGMMCRIVTDEESVQGTHFVCARPQTDAGFPALPKFVKQKDHIMTDKPKVRVTIADKQIDLEASVADSVQNAVAEMTTAHTTAVDKLTTEHEAALAVKDAELVTANDAIATLKKEAPTRDAIVAEITECTAIRDTAKSLGLELKVADTDTPRSLKTALIAHKMGDKNTITEDSADETVNSVYDALTSALTTKPKGALDGQVVESKATEARATHDSHLINARNTKKGA
ncbi:MAG: DUF2213 domain-containing protein [Gammaproteobacteria bacterium]|nr:DUF2213 domain-containing protein [Gammaproteobacteria bacterium]